MSGFDFDHLDSADSVTMPNEDAEEAETAGTGNSNDRLLFFAKDATEYKSWKKWVEAHLADIEDKVAAKRLGPILCVWARS